MCIGLEVLGAIERHWSLLGPIGVFGLEAFPVEGGSYQPPEPINPMSLSTLRAYQPYELSLTLGLRCGSRGGIQGCSDCDLDLPLCSSFVGSRTDCSNN